MKALKLATILAMMTAAPALAQSQPEGARLAELSFDSVDTTGRGFIDQGQMEEMRGDIFVSMDSDENGKLSEAEWLSWDFGFSNIAEETGRELAYRTALRIVFSIQDRNSNGEISETEHRQALAYDFRRADLDDNAVLDKSEFTSGFGILVALRTALKPE